MQATSAAPSPVLPAANSASPVDSQSAAASLGEGDGAASTPFAAVLGKLKAPADAAALIVAKKLVDLEAAASPSQDAKEDVPADAIAILASMLNGVTLPAQAKPTTDAPLTAPRSDVAEEPAPAADAAALAAAALPIAAPLTANAPHVATPAKADVAATQTSVLPKDSGATAPAAPAIVAAATAAKTEASAETGKEPQDGKFAALMDAARKAGDAAAANANATTANVAASTTHVTPAPHATNAAATQVPVTTPVGAEGWGHEVGDKLNWMVGRQETRADLILNPPQLGRIEVSLSMNGDQASATFVSANPAVRDALENAMPHLREVLQGAGISLGQTQVGAESFQQSANSRENGDNSRRDNAHEDDAGSAATGAVAGAASPARWLRGGNGLVDTFV